MDLHLEGRVAIVTGASRGIGLAVTRALLDEGAQVVAAARASTRSSRLTSPSPWARPASSARPATGSTSS
jgi:NAD(P)-dependent dehydrogenase (short-subunit alcohol dehydrogenase family)